MISVTKSVEVHFDVLETSDERLRDFILDYRSDFYGDVEVDEVIDVILNKKYAHLKSSVVTLIELLLKIETSSIVYNVLIWLEYRPDCFSEKILNTVKDISQNHRNGVVKNKASKILEKV